MPKFSFFAVSQSNASLSLRLFKEKHTTYFLSGFRSRRTKYYFEYFVLLDLKFELRYSFNIFGNMLAGFWF